jgi:hypothetical protein
MSHVGVEGEVGVEERGACEGPAADPAGVSGPASAPLQVDPQTTIQEEPLATALTYKKNFCEN